MHNSLSTTFYRNGDCCALCYDITDRNTFEALGKWKRTFIQSRDPDNPNKFPFILIGNKVDQTLSRQVSFDEANKWAKDNNVFPYFETSALDGTNVS